jgi:hypothetical protein
LCFELLDKLLRKIVDNPDDDKYRSLKQDNKKVKYMVTRHKGGVMLMKLVGFLEETNSEGQAVWSNQGSVSYVKGVRLDLAAGLSLI